MKKSLISLLAVPLVRLLIVLAFGMFTAQARGQEAVYQDDEVKAAFLYHFTTFVQWPQSTAPGEEFVIAVYGADAVVEELGAFLPGRTVQGRRMGVRRLQSIDDAEGAAVLFIGASQSGALPRLIDRVRDRPMLVVTEARGALREGAMINFQIVDQRVRFEISMPAAERAGLELSSRLLSAAMFVDTTSALAPPAGIVLASAASD